MQGLQHSHRILQHSPASGVLSLPHRPEVILAFTLSLNPTPNPSCWFSFQSYAESVLLITPLRLRTAEFNHQPLSPRLSHQLPNQKVCSILSLITSLLHSEPWRNGFPSKSKSRQSPFSASKALPGWTTLGAQLTLTLYPAAHCPPATLGPLALLEHTGKSPTPRPFHPEHLPHSLTTSALHLNIPFQVSLLLSPYINLVSTPLLWLPRWLSGKESACQCRRHGFDPWV